MYWVFARLFPILIHSISDADRACNQVIRSISRDVELYLVEAMGDLLIGCVAHYIYPTGILMHDKAHKERLLLAEFRNLLHYHLVIAVT